MAKALNPWQKVLAKFDMSKSDMAKHLNVHRSKLTRAVKGKGLISGSDQEELLKCARRLGVHLSPADLTPEV